jgi:hypothetical protein
MKCIKGTHTGDMSVWLHVPSLKLSVISMQFAVEDLYKKLLAKVYIT